MPENTHGSPTPDTPELEPPLDELLELPPLDEPLDELPPLDELLELLPPLDELDDVLGSAGGSSSPAQAITTTVGSTSTSALFFMTVAVPKFTRSL